MNNEDEHIQWFRNSLPYINAHRHKTFVVYIGGEAIDSGHLPGIINDVALLSSLGVRLVLVHGAAPQIDRRLKTGGKPSTTIQQRRITTPDILDDVVETIGRVKSVIEARLSTGLANSPMYGAGIVVTSGNFVKARPLGIIEGTDYHNTGVVRKINTTAINRQLDNGAIVLVSPVGYSPSGETFNMVSLDLAVEIAVALKAEKMIFFSASGLKDDSGNVINELPSPASDEVLKGMTAEDRRLYSLASRSCQSGVSRCHIISHTDDGALLQELFTRDGAGTQVTRVSYEQIRPAAADDIPGIIELIQPLEDKGILVRRSRELIESEIDRFTVIDRDGLIVGCAALYPWEQEGELACLATHPDYRDNDRGDQLLTAIESQGRSLNLCGLFVLTTQSAHWFMERGFAERDIDSLPADRKSLYNYQRSSKLFRKPLV